MTNWRSTLIGLVMLTLVLVFMTPLLWTLYASFVAEDIDLKTSLFKTGKYTLENYTYIVDNSGILRWLFNSVFVTVTLTATNLIFNSMAGFALAKYQFPGRQWMTAYALLLIMIPIQVVMIPVFVQIHEFGMINSYAGLIVPFMINPFGVFLMRQYFLKFPNDYIDTVRMEGGSLYSLLRHVVFPISKGALVTQGLIVFIWNWNNYIFPSIIVNDIDLFTLPLGIAQITNTKNVPSVAMSMAGTIISLIPILIIYFAMQKQIIGADSDSGIK